MLSICIVGTEADRQIRELLPAAVDVVHDGSRADDCSEHRSDDAERQQAHAAAIAPCRGHPVWCLGGLTELDRGPGRVVRGEHPRRPARPTGGVVDRSADDVAALIRHLNLGNADVMGYSLGGGVALPGVPFDARRGVIPNAQGRVIDPDTPATRVGEYVVGWIKRGPSGIIGTNKPDSQETAAMLVEDAFAGKLLMPDEPSAEAFDRFIRGRQPAVVSFADWQRLDQDEIARGTAVGRPRMKYSRVEDMLNKVTENRSQQHPVEDQT